MPGNDNRGQTDARFREPRLNGKAPDLRHVQVKDDTIRLVLFHGVQELGPGGERFHAETRRTEQPLEGDAHRFFVIHHGNEKANIVHKGEC